jgi:hypothetical protein
MITISRDVLESVLGSSTLGVHNENGSDSFDCVFCGAYRNVKGNVYGGTFYFDHEIKHYTSCTGLKIVELLILEDPDNET